MVSSSVGSFVANALLAGTSYLWQITYAWVCACMLCYAATLSGLEYNNDNNAKWRSRPTLPGLASTSTTSGNDLMGISGRPSLIYRAFYYVFANMQFTALTGQCPQCA